MRTTFFFIALLILTVLNAYSQDNIIRTNGEKINCKILREDKTNIYILLTKNNQKIETYVRKSDIKSIEYYDYSNDTIPLKPFSLGIGLGLDYGGIGLNVQFNPHKYIGLFAGGGFALAGFGYNAGLKFNISPTQKANPYLLAMYGYNASIAIKDAAHFNKLFFGPSFGIGVDIKRKFRKTYWSIAVLFPVRNSGVNDYIQDLEDNYDVKFNNSLLPVTISIGYRF